jgi:hypothetical protein
MDIRRDLFAVAFWVVELPSIVVMSLFGALVVLGAQLCVLGSTTTVEIDCRDAARPGPMRVEVCAARTCVPCDRHPLEGTGEIYYCEEWRTPGAGCRLKGGKDGE